MHRLDTKRPRALPVHPGQVFSVLTGSPGSRQRDEFRVDRIEGDRVFGWLVGKGRCHSLTLRALVRRARGARLVVDGVPQSATTAGTRSHRSLHRRARMAGAMAARGKTPEDIAEHFGVAVHTARCWVRLARREQVA